MSSEMGFALFKAVALGLGLCIFYLVAHLISQLTKKLSKGLNKLGEGPKAVAEQLRKNDEGK